jgi:hypothetical protein
LTIEEQRQALKETVRSFGDWKQIAARVGNGQSRSCTQVKSAVKAVCDKLQRLEIKLQHPDNVDALPQRFFAGKGAPHVPVRIREEFLHTRIATLKWIVEQDVMPARSE